MKPQETFIQFEIGKKQNIVWVKLVRVEEVAGKNYIGKCQGYSEYFPAFSEVELLETGFKWLNKTYSYLGCV